MPGTRLYCRSVNKIHDCCDFKPLCLVVFVHSNGHLEQKRKVGGKANELRLGYLSGNVHLKTEHINLEVREGGAGMRA